MFGPGHLSDVEYDANSPTTAGLYRYRTSTESHFVKVINSYRRWPMIEFIAEGFRRMALETDLWRYEADAHLSDLRSSLPRGLRLPELHSVEMLDDDHLLLVVEDVQIVDFPWDADRYGHAAELLGRLAARITRDDVLPATAFRTPGRMTPLMYEGFVKGVAIPAVLDPTAWAHPLLAGTTDLHEDLLTLIAKIPALLDDLIQRPQLMGHGDACPQNLLVDSPDTFVGIDWTPSGLVAAGDDLGQLLIGRAHSGELDVAGVANLRELVIGRYHAGLVAEGRSDITADDVRAGMDGALVIRSAFLSLPVDRLTEPVTPELTQFVIGRIALTRYLVGLGTASLTA
ncbi:aminoglycoside phosphotransferase family protein [Kribbella sp. NBC_01505]|uniref:phosphotransferase n=1 Tax=Kribbella sp. NBC_01505 TaxID=2903580 RepID=UPI00386B2906